MNYSAVIRTLGSAGEKYQQLLNSLNSQTVAPTEIIVYIAEGYPLPKETIGKERYVYVEKGMVAQRSLSYNEVTTDYILFLDDDLAFPPETVENMFFLLNCFHADVIAPDIFPNAQRNWRCELLMTLSGRMRPRYNDDLWGYKVMRTAGYSYNKKPIKEVYQSQTNAGACFLCKKRDFLNIKFDEEKWIDAQTYALGEDQVMYYKMYLNKLKVLTWYGHRVKHLDAGHNMTLDKELNRLYSDLYFKNVFWHRFIYLPEKSYALKLWSIICLLYVLVFTILISAVKFNKQVLSIKYNAIRDAWAFIQSDEYKTLPRIVKMQ
jgi:glycosyltransferase involved in cell wall biosynthesis